MPSFLHMRKVVCKIPDFFWKLFYKCFVSTIRFAGFMLQRSIHLLPSSSSVTRRLRSNHECRTGFREFMKQGVIVSACRSVQIRLRTLVIWTFQNVLSAC